MNTTEIKKMTAKEKVLTMELLWNSLIENSDDIEIPEWHKTILDKRIKKIEDGTAEFYNLDEVKSFLALYDL